MLQFIQNLKQYDILISNFLFHIRNGYLINIFLLITNLVSPLVVAILMILFIASTIFLKQKRFIIPMILSVLFAVTSANVLKNIFERLRPSVGYYLETGFSFPSAHSTVAVAFYGFIIYFLLSNIKTLKNKFLVVLLFSILILLIGFSRMYLGVHYLTDVVGGFLLGGVCLYSSIFIFKAFFYKKRNKVSK